MKKILFALTLLSYTAQAEIIINGTKVTCTSNCSTTISGGTTVMCSGSSCVTISAGGVITVGGSTNPVEGKQHR